MSVLLWQYDDKKPLNEEYQKGNRFGSFFTLIYFDYMKKYSNSNSNRGFSLMRAKMLYKSAVEIISWNIKKSTITLKIYDKSWYLRQNKKLKHATKISSPTNWKPFSLFNYVGVLGVYFDDVDHGCAGCQYPKNIFILEDRFKLEIF